MQLFKTRSGDTFKQFILTLFTRPPVFSVTCATPIEKALCGVTKALLKEMKPDLGDDEWQCGMPLVLILELSHMQRDTGYGQDLMEHHSNMRCERSCWVCFATDEDDRTAEWVRPCRCRGSTKWVHQSCLQRWVDEKQRGNSTARVACPQCNAEYLIVFPKLGPVVYVLDLADRLISKAGPFAAAGIMVGSIYWTAVTYGAVTVMQVVGHKEGLDVMERADPLFLLIGLPTIPVMLILGKMIRWEDYVLRLWRKYSNKLQILNSIFPGLGCPVPRIPAEANPLADHVSATRILCGALVFPTIATIVGKLMFSSVNSNLQRTILGGIAFVAIKGAFKVYFKQQQYLRQAHRKILNFPEPEEA
ncbi:E3 ubiquitin-protein ligase MARCH5 [Merluccius polli]|uniref:E3 ubiquitin-protein ligase MARCHF5 n=1 Tax=Merluccius polli TaxID=89951 RepID=A0AA47MCI2_MERPO|nr:E3 ubiquitin-protein ligase MARCH5 [Merluccius polli]